MRLETLNDVAEWGSGGTPKRSNPDYFGSGIPWLSIADLNDGVVDVAKESLTPEGLKNSSAKLVPSGTLFVAMYGSIGKLGIAGREMATSQAIAFAKPKREKVEPQFLFHYLFAQRANFQSRGRGGTQMNIGQGDLKSWPIPLPTLDQQRRIADILDKTDALRAKRRETIAKLDSLSQSIFHEMFGDPAANDRDWSTHDLGVVLRGIDSGSSPVCSSRPASGNECGLLKLGAVTSGTWKPGENKAFTDAAPNVRNEVRAGDVLFSRKNTPSLVAAVARVDDVPQRLFLPDLIFRLCIRDQEQMLPEFLTALLQYPTQKRTIQRLATGSAQSMVNISKAKLLGIPVVVPPLELQQQFSNRVAAVERLKAKHRVQLDELDNLFLSLQDRAFKGEL